MGSSTPEVEHNRTLLHKFIGVRLSSIRFDSLNSTAVRLA